MPPTVPDFRAAPPLATASAQLGPLAELAGTWKGHGFNLISRPDFKDGNPLFLQLNATDEMLVFNAIGGPIPNRGAHMTDIEIFGVHYLQQISDHDTGSAIHIEPGIWLNVPETTVPPLPPTVVRLATIPHGNSILVQGSGFPSPTGQPLIVPVSPTPFEIGGPPSPGVQFPEFDLTIATPFRSPTPTGVVQAIVDNPNLVLANAIAGQNITSTIVLDVSTAVPEDNPLNFGGGQVEIPFDVRNADVADVSAIFWIETVQFPPPYDDLEYLQLQYTQTVILNFDGLSWPHVSVATLLKVT